MLNFNFSRTFIRTFAVLALFISSIAHAQLRVEIAGVGANQIPIAIAAFGNESIAPHQVSEIIKADLNRSGYFKIIDTGVVLTENSQVNLADWKSKGADALVVGSVERLADGRFDVKYRLFDTVNNKQLSSLALAANPAFIRVSAHKVADDIFEKLTGIPGAFATRIAYVTKAGREYRLEIADSDGQGNQIALRSNEPIISPSWSPDGTKVAYVSFENKKPVIYVQDLVTRVRSVAANYKGSNSAPAWSPDGKRLAIALSRDGLTQVYIVNTDGTGLRRLSNSNGIDTEPRFSADGQNIYFTSDRSGGPQIYRMSANGGEARRVTFSGSYNISPRVSPDGKYLAYISRREGKFQVYIQDLTNGQEQRLSDTVKDEAPSFSPNGKYVMYATESGRRGTLAVVSVDGRVKQTLSTQAGDINEPTWGPFMK
ncbi:Tol-Pal system beta propeller repeat protein TolB [uncultured Oxalicibacterium sp.]|uniref:Tol-Pal system beta propeller repeat protein TolB n=1 Tax=uncultured Oxalicibacterium sp. TaxID=1168540 RepID=UPI0025E666A3|nr:Tol-Pal system beta propeller repeat protein TolB [uncultured Oxalicibacterium sp.]